MRSSLTPFLLLSFSIFTCCSSYNVPIIQTTSGKLQGVAVSNTTNAYLGLPFAIPPIGQLRFQAPRPLVTPNIARNATSFGPACVQLPATVFLESPSGESEDCLHLNVWTSCAIPGQAAIPKKGKPVFIWIYGGAWNSGFTSMPAYNFTDFVNAHPEIIIVSLNYRLNLFGYAHSPAISGSETNAGLRDQRLAIEWIHKNIAAFGGDPNRLVLGGQSAGAGNSFLSGVILMSGDATVMSGSPPFDIPGGPNNGPDPFPILANAAGCPLEGNNSVAQLDCLKQKSTKQLVDVLREHDNQGITPYVDSRTVFSLEDYRSKGLSEKFAKVPTLIGTTNHEGDLFVWVGGQLTSINQTLSDEITVSLFTCPLSHQANYSISAGVPTYRYRYMPVFPAVSQLPLRTFHGSELPILFDNVEDGFIEAPSPTELEHTATKYMQKAWAAFISNPESGLRQFGWPLYGGSNGAKTLVELFPDNNVQNPILLENPMVFDSLCSA
ncbi:alpha/beta-hydrolase [Serendipita vermifera]|nr:alpha/beta-hydrolase [Serendipita vermifera]